MASGTFNFSFSHRSFLNEFFGAGFGGGIVRSTFGGKESNDVATAAVVVIADYTNFVV